jgi:hypothetical protein
MFCYKLKDGSLLIPVRAETDGIVGDTLKRITKDDPDYSDWEKEAMKAPAPIEQNFSKK